MTHLKAIYKDYSACCKNFSDGIDYLHRRAIQDATRSFQLACNSISASHSCRNKYISYLGFARLLSGDADGLILCRKAATAELKDGDVYLNLARAEFLLNSRCRTIAALDRGLEVDSQHEGLWLMRNTLGIRRKKLIPFLSRDHAFNIKLGCLLRKSRRGK
ncbi:MAG: hypothetical protein OEZ38_01315 [Gammaproteobacteria bacterium]|nr:hypothetical protein [Gammaproteobacteria bacterium]